MAVAFYSQIKINAVYLTASGADNGTKYISIVRGLNALALTKTAQVVKALDGTPYANISSTVKGKEISIEFPSMLKADYQNVVDEIQDSLDTPGTIALEILDGDYGDFTLTVLPDADPVRFPGEFENGRLKNVAFHFITT